MMQEATKKPLKPSDLNRLFSDSKSQLSEHLAEARTNNNLFMGNHFQKKGSKINRSLEVAAPNEDTRIRITKNHINTIVKYIINSILHMSPTGVIEPKNPSEIQDQKSAEIHRIIFEDYKIRNKFKKMVRTWAHHFVISGEVFVNVFWDDTKGLKIKENPIYDQLGNVIGIKPPGFEGDAVCETVYPWDMRMDTGAKTPEEAMWMGYEKMVDGSVIKRHFGDHPDIDKACAEDMDETFKVFEASSGTYKEAKGKVLLKQIYYRPCTDYPNGYYVFFTKEIILAEGELPQDQNGNVFFPIHYVGFDEVATSPRCVSIIKQIRPEQMEVNRCASNIAQIQQSVGMDKMIIPSGGNAEAGATVAGVRIIKVPGGKQNADIIQGKSGDQFLGTLQQNITEMYSKTGVPENWDEKAQDVDIMASLYKSMKQKTRFSLYGEKFSEFLVEVIGSVLRLKKAYMTDEAFFRVTGKMEYANIDEFRALDDIGYQIKIEQGTEDLESRFGRYMALKETMQYMGSNLDQNSMGMIIKNLPFANGEEIHAKLTQPYENAKNILLALDRGEMPEISQVGNPLYMAEELNFRMYKPDFKYLNQQIQQNYQIQKQQYQQLYTQQLQEVQRAQAGFIPSDGPTVPVDGMYEQTIGSNGQPRTTRVQVPQAAIEWVIEKLKAQGSAMGDITSQPLGMQAEIANQYMGALEQAPQQPQMAPMQGMPY